MVQMVVKTAAGEDGGEAAAGERHAVLAAVSVGGLSPDGGRVRPAGRDGGNPMGADEAGGDASMPGAVSQADVEAALEELGHNPDLGTVGARLALAAWANKLLDARVGPAGDLGATIKQAATEIVAHFSESPTNWCDSPPGSWGLMVPHVRTVQFTHVADPSICTRRHQATAHYAGAQEPGDGPQRWALAVGGFAMVLLQCAACLAVFWGMNEPSCATNDQCGTGGTFCASDKVCRECGGGEGMPLQVDPATGLASNTGFDPGNYMHRLPAGATDWSGGFNTTAAFAWCAGDPVCGYERGGADLLCRTANNSDPAAVVRWCDACLHPTHVDATVYWEDITVSNVGAMGPFDWLTLLLCSAVTATAVVGELRDIELCLVALDRADPPLPAGWRLALRGLAIVRRYTFLPMLIVAVPTVVVLQGGDALSICFNTVAVLFLTEVE